MRPTSIALGWIAVALLAAPAWGGPLATHPDAYFDGVTTWHGSTDFVDGISGTLEGSVDWAVFGPGDFPVAFGGYAPTFGELVYTYQINVTGSSILSSLSVAIDAGQPVNNIGSFTGGGVSGTSTSAAFFSPAATPDTAVYQFAGIGTGETSVGLAYSSSHVPMEFFGSVLNGGLGAFVDPLPSPSPTPIPEPSTVMLAMCGMFAVVGWNIRKRLR
jgi:hypothetical protein